MELKFHDLDTDDASIAQNGTIIQGSVNQIAQGTTEITRIGRKCTIKKIHWRFNITLTATTASANTSETVRVILYWDKQTNKAAAGITDILESDNFQSFRNLANKGRFRILMDRTYQLKAGSGGGDGTTEDYGEDSIDDEFHKDCTIPVEFNAATGAVTEMTTNNVGILLLSKAGAITAFEGKMRIRFSDM